MEDLESYKLWKGLLGIAGLVLLYYAGTRGVVVLTRRWAGRWYRRVLVSLSFAALFAPSFIGVGAHGGFFPSPAWVTALDTASRNRWADFFTWGLAPIGIMWVAFFSVSSFMSLMSNNKNYKKVDTYGKES
jgi:hypothetical protein